MITFRYRIKPSRAQVGTLCRHLETCRHLYNRLLEELNRAHEAGETISWQSAVGLVPKWKKSTFPELQGVYSRVAAMVAKQLFSNLASLSAIKRRSRKVGRLRFKGQGGFNSLNYNQSGFKIDWARGAIRLSKVGEVRARFHRIIPSELRIKGVIVKRTGTGKWFACLQCEEPRDKEVPRLGESPESLTGTKLARSGRAVGIDLGIVHFAADSEGTFAEHPQLLENSLAKVKILQRALSRKKKASSRRQKVKFALAKAHEKLKNQRYDFLHKLSRYYVENYDIICAEDLGVAGMLQEKRIGAGRKANKTLHRHIADAGWRAFLAMLAYKARSAGKLAFFVDPRGTSQECAACGATVSKKLWERVHACPYCGFVIDRDTNSSLVILKRGMGRTPKPVELALLRRVAGASAGAETGTLIENHCIILQ